ncbi:MAG TPA: rhomboid family intramembrane serine protease [Actinocrinis sp.]
MSVPHDKPPGVGLGEKQVAPPVCFRHPGRETYLRCARCERSICTECMVAAPVGFHCPECLKEGNRTVREVRTAAGGRTRSRQGVVTVAIIVVCVAMYAMQSLIGQAFTDRMDLQAMTPHMAALPNSGPIGVAYGEWYRLFTSIFVHESIVHLGLNMISLWWIGLPVESRLGRSRFLAAFVVCGLAGSAVAYAGLGQYGSALGASGAIFGLLGVLTVLAFKEKLDLRPIMAIVVLNVVFDFVEPGISWQDHLGGFAAGLVLGGAFAYAPRPSTAVAWFRNTQNVLSAAAVVLVLGIAAVIVLLHTGELRAQAGASALTEQWRLVKR